MVSALIEDLPPETSGFLRRRARRAGAASVVEHVRHELITLARESAPADQLVEFLAEHRPSGLEPEVDHDAIVLARVHRLPEDVWETFCRRAAALNVPVSVHVRDELVGLSRRGTVDDVMWEFAEAQERDPSLDIDFEAVLEAVRYARGLD